jgi:hypothetical protein
MNLFDDLQQKAQSIVEHTMGYDATWVPSAGGSAITGRVLLNKPTQKESIGEIDYEALRPRIEFFDGQFPGLLDSVKANNTETVTVNGIEYSCFPKGSGKFDGKTIIIYLDQL